ncbi:hypothetical protein LSG31_17895 [Fodinisporobacter ferrooxydans]|uniref:Uncharacterized protein n=1 Tax=Fodinisporobacter ferrooxydans TaxID=2901836 RepID=A0ABY4CGU6_9BACL|nr:hypothetical protein LSG31_17895 [Alicyclobacillaceae bacterium MYW30-H2]
MDLLKGVSFAFILSIFLSIGLTFLPVHHLSVDWMLPSASHLVSSNPLERSIRILSNVRTYGRIERIERKNGKIYVTVSAGQRNLDANCLRDAYTILYQLTQRSAIEAAEIRFVNVLSNQKVGSVYGENKDFKNPLPNREQIVEFVKQHFQIEYN